MIPRTPRWTLVTAVALACLAASGFPAELRASELPLLKYVDVADSVVMLQNEKPHGSNMTCFVLEDGLLFVDASLFTGIAGKFRKDMEAKFGKRTIALLLSHAHTDHFFGMGAFADVPVVAAAAARERFRQQLGIDFASHVEDYKQIFPKFDEALETARPFMPTIWFETEIEFGSGDGAVRFRNTGGHSTGSSYAYSPAARVVAAGDNLQVGAHPYFGDPTTDIDAWIATLQRWESSRAESFCPGHGRAVDRAYLASTRVYFQDLVSTLAKLKAAGVPVEEAVLHPDLPSGYWGDAATEPRWYRPAIARLYQSIQR